VMVHGEITEVVDSDGAELLVDIGIESKQIMSRSRARDVDDADDNTLEIVTDDARMPYAMPSAVEHPENQRST
jgi:hypothetical protein